MKNTLFLIFILTISYSQECKWKHGNFKYDFSSLQKKDYWEVKQDQKDSGFFTLAYVFNFCGKNPTQCDGIPGAYQALDVMGSLTQSCDLMGQNQQQQISMIGNQKGLQIKYPMGETCETSENISDIGQPKSITFDVMCGSKAGEWKVIPSNSNDVTSCNVKLQITHPAGCYAGQLSGFFTYLINIIIFSFVIFALYLIIGTLYNQKKKNLQGKQSIPHYEYLKDAPEMIIKYTKLLVYQVKTQSQAVIDKMKKNKNPYQTVDDNDYNQI